MPKSLELRNVVRILKRFGITYVTGKGRHPKFYDPEAGKSYPVKSHGKKTLVLLALGSVMLPNQSSAISSGLSYYIGA